MNTKSWSIYPSLKRLRSEGTNNTNKREGTLAVKTLTIQLIKIDFIQIGTKGINVVGHGTLFYQERKNIIN